MYVTDCAVKKNIVNNCKYSFYEGSDSEEFKPTAPSGTVGLRGQTSHPLGSNNHSDFNLLFYTHFFLTRFFVCSQIVLMPSKKNCNVNNHKNERKEWNEIHRVGPNFSLVVHISCVMWWIVGTVSTCKAPTGSRKLQNIGFGLLKKTLI